MKSNGTTRNHAWAYDALYRLTNEVVSGTAPTGLNRYRYDAVGNRTNRTTTFTGIAALTNQSFTYGGNDLLANDTYDSNGNTRTNAANTYAYDVENRLTNYNNGAASYIYNGDGWLVRKTIGTTTTFYLVDDRNPTGYAQTVEEATVTSGVTNLAVIYLPGLDLVAQNRSGTVSYYGYDGNSNTRYLSGSGATVTDTYLYDAFGVLLASTGSTVNEFTYSGERLMPETGLTYLRARYLNSGTGRFWSRDNFGGEKTEPLSLHKYLYAHADPILGTDPSGNENVISVSAGTSIAIGLALFTAFAVSKAKFQAQGSISFSLGGAAAEEADEFSIASQNAIAAAETAITLNYGSFRDLLNKAKDEVIRLGRSVTRPKVVPMPAAVIPNVATHVATAQASGHPFFLTRVDAARARINRRAATATAPPAGAGFSNDEYPFASSDRGGRGASVVPVPFRENLIQGGIISVCYRFEKINVGDSYFVVVIP